MNTYTHLGLEDATEEMHHMEQVENVRKDVEVPKKEKPMWQNMFRAV